MYFAQRQASHLGLFRRGRYPLGIACAGSNPVGDEIYMSHCARAVKGVDSKEKLSAGGTLI